MDNPTTTPIQTLYMVGEDAQGREVLRELLARPFEPDSNKSKK